MTMHENHLNFSRCLKYMLWILMALGPASLQANPFEPTVSREESEWIKNAISVAVSNQVEAIASLESRRTAKSSPAIDFTIGNLHFQAGDETRAMSAYQDAIKKMPGFRSARVNLARLYLLDNQATEAMNLLRDVTTDGRGDADSYLLLGHALLLTDALVSAETAYRQSLMLNPRNPDALIGLARALLPQDRAAESLALSNELLQRDPMRRELWALRANALMDMNRADDAATALESARRLGFADSELLATLGDLHLNAGRPDDAVMSYEEAFKGEEPSVTRLLRAYEGLLLARQFDAAKKIKSRFAELQKNNPDLISRDQRVAALRLNGDLALQTGDQSAARKYFESLLRENPLDGKALLQIAELLRAQDQLEEAVMHCERAARVADVRADALLLHAQIEVQRERFIRAVELLEEAQMLYPRERVQRYLDQVKRMQRYDMQYRDL